MRMPALTGGTGWLNSEPLGPAELRGHVVLINFWTLTCINWLRQEPYVRAWSQAYRDDGLVVIGVHAPEFSFEHEVDRVRRAAKERDITYPILIDNDFTIWRAFDNHYWPALYFIDRDGVIRHSRFGEGSYERSERTLQQLLGVERDLVGADGIGAEAAAEWDQLRTPETYLGYARGSNFTSSTRPVPDVSVRYEIPNQLRFNQWALDGAWTIGDEKVTLDQAGGTIAFRFHARDAHLVMSPGPREPIPFQVLLDGAPPKYAHGLDIGEDGRALLADGRLHQLVRQPDEIFARTLQITFADPGAEAYAFTFG
jgi:thiol-disulfide isomerase/thioredoxin